MGQWTDIIISMGISEEEDERIAEVNAYLQRDMIYNPQPFVQTAIEGNLYVGTYKNFDLAAFLHHVSTGVKWSDPEKVQVFVQLDNEEQFKLVQGVQAYDHRFEDRDHLLGDAECLAEFLRDGACTDKTRLDALEWLAEYTQFKERLASGYYDKDFG